MPKELVRLRKLEAGRYQTVDGRYNIERQDGTTGCDHPKCDVLHRKWHESTMARGSGGGWMHWVTYVAWHIWDNERADYAAPGLVEYDTKWEAHESLTALIEGRDK
jgi:hypothetical protein